MSKETSDLIAPTTVDMDKIVLQGKRPAIIFVIGPPNGGKTTLIKRITSKYPQVDHIYVGYKESMNGLLQQVYPPNRDVSNRPCIIDNFTSSSATYQDWSTLVDACNAKGSKDDYRVLVTYVDVYPPVARMRYGDNETGTRFERHKQAAKSLFLELKKEQEKNDEFEILELESVDVKGNLEVDMKTWVDMVTNTKTWKKCT